MWRERSGSGGARGTMRRGPGKPRQNRGKGGFAPLLGLLQAKVVLAGGKALAKQQEGNTRKIMCWLKKK